MYRYVKRVFDLFFSALLLLLLSPLLLVIYVWLTIANKGAGAIFSQLRPGMDERIFKLYKFKSMTDERDNNGNLLPDAERITRVGKFIRKTSLDELPQLWNVLKGDMSFVGPRPLLVQYLPYYTDDERLRHSVRPGITGLAQVNGRNRLTWEQRLGLDVEYTKKVSLGTDLSIILKTIGKVLKSSDVVVVLDPNINVRLDDYRKRQH